MKEEQCMFTEHLWSSLQGNKLAYWRLLYVKTVLNIQMAKIKLNSLSFCQQGSVHYQVVLSRVICEQLYHMSITQTYVLRQQSNMKQSENLETENKKIKSTQFYITCRLKLLLLLLLNVQKGFFLQWSSY